MPISFTSRSVQDLSVAELEWILAQITPARRRVWSAEHGYGTLDGITPVGWAVTYACGCQAIQAPGFGLPFHWLN